MSDNFVRYIKLSHNHALYIIKKWDINADSYMICKNIVSVLQKKYVNNTIEYEDNGFRNEFNGTPTVVITNPDSKPKLSGKDAVSYGYENKERVFLYSHLNCLILATYKGEAYNSLSEVYEKDIIELIDNLLDTNKD